MRIWIGIGLAIIAAALAVIGVYVRPDRGIRVATGFIAHNVCSKTFVSGLDSQAAFAELSGHTHIRSLTRFMQLDVDRTARTIDASTFGLFRSRAAFHDGFGCVDVHGERQPYLLKSDVEALKAKTPPSLPEIAGDAVVEPSDPALRAALDHAFEEPAAPPFRRTRAVVVVHNGKVIAERYAAGIGVDTPLPGFSLTKSVVNALIGILTQQGLVTPSMPAPVAEWRGAADPRREIEVEHLMRMTSGLDLDGTSSTLGRAGRMFLEDDTGGYAVQAPLIAPVGKRWAYSSPTTQILARIIRNAAGGPEQALALAWRELFNPLGMRHATLEFDAAGTLIGSTSMLASARDWGKLGLLYLGDGMAGDKRILHPDWVDFSAAATPNTDYAAGFWTNRSEHPAAKARVAAGMPRDTFFAFGDLGQYIIIVPSQHLVVVRLGDSVDPAGDIGGVARLVKEVIAAVSPPSSRGDAPASNPGSRDSGSGAGAPSRNDGAQ